jgi:Tfp pilus assembly protein PilX
MNSNKKGSILVMVVVLLLMLTLLGVGILGISYGLRHQANVAKHETEAMLAAEAGYENAMFWMSKQQDMLHAMKNGGTHKGTINFDTSTCDYEVSFNTFVDARPVYEIKSIGYSGDYSREVDVVVMQAINGWATNSMKIPDGQNSASPAYFGTGETIDMPFHVNKLNDSPDDKDLYISGTPQFTQPVTVGEGRYRTNGTTDKYGGVLSLFQKGISFNQPEVRVIDHATITAKANRFKNTTKSQYTFTPTAGSFPLGSDLSCLPAVQIEFYVEGGIGKVKITNNCTVVGYKDPVDGRTWDYAIRPGFTDKFDKYYIYAYHAKPDTETPTIVPIADTYVTQRVEDMESQPGGQIFVNGNVVIGGDNPLHDNDQLIHGKMMVVATGFIWVADNLLVDGDRDAVTNKPVVNNENVLGLISEKMVRVVDPGMTEAGFTNVYTTPPAGYTYVPIGRPDTISAAAVAPAPAKRCLPNPTVVEAAVTSALGGFGPENLPRYGAPYRKMAPGTNLNTLIVRGTITDAIIALTFIGGTNGYYSNFQMDERILRGILPGDIWLTAKFLPAPGGWCQFRTNNCDEGN